MRLVAAMERSKEMLNNRRIEYLLALEKHGSFIKAAQALNVSQPALSRMVGEIEKSLNVTLFHRNHTPISPTKFGEIYLNACRKVMSIEKNAIEEIFDTVEGRKGMFTIAFNSAVCRFLIPDLIPQYKAEFPNIHVNVIEKSFYLLEDLVLNGTADLAVVLSANNDRLSYRYITTETLYLAIPPSYAKKMDLKPGFNDCNIPIEEIRDEPFILLREKHGLRKTADTIFSDAEIVPNIILETDDFLISQQLTSSDLGFSFSSSCTINPKSKDVYYCLTSDPTGSRKLYLCTEKDRYNSNAFTSLSEMIITLIKKHKEHQ